MKFFNFFKKKLPQTSEVKPQQSENELSNYCKTIKNRIESEENEKLAILIVKNNMILDKLKQLKLYLESTFTFIDNMEIIIPEKNCRFSCFKGWYIDDEIFLNVKINGVSINIIGNSLLHINDHHGYKLQITEKLEDIARANHAKQMEIK
jgi:hypothetical protein